MMHSEKQPQRTPSAPEPQWAEAHIAVAIGDQYLLNDGRLAQQAVSCLVAPEVGDRVMVVACSQNDNYIVHLLTRVRSKEVCLHVPGAEQLTIRQPRIALHATEQVALRSLRDVEVTAATGVLTLTARNLFTSVSESLVENIRHYVGNVEQYLLDVKQFLRMHGKQTSITAEQDVKVDAERISIG